VVSWGVALVRDADQGIHSWRRRSWSRARVSWFTLPTGARGAPNGQLASAPLPAQIAGTYELHKLNQSDLLLTREGHAEKLKVED
jgi:hypothetical protein